MGALHGVIVVGTLTHLETLTGPFTAFGPDIQSLEIELDGGSPNLVVIAGQMGTTRFLEYDIGNSIALTNQGYLGFTSGDFTSLDYGTDVLQFSDWRLGFETDDLLETGTSGFQVGDLNSEFYGDTVFAGWATTTSNTWLVSSIPGQTGLTSFHWDGSGFTATDTTAGITNTTMSGVSTLNAFGQDWVIGTSAVNDVVSVYSLSNAGDLEFVSRAGPETGVWFNDPAAHSIFEIDGQSFVLVASNESSSLSVLRLEPNGDLVAVDHVIDDLDTRFANATNIETVTVGNNVYAVASGGDDGFSLFQVRPDGHLIHLETVADTDGTSLKSIKAIQIGYEGGDLHIFVASEEEVGLSHFTYDIQIGGVTQLGSPVSETMNGTAWADTLIAGAGNDTILGGAGDDMIADGGGQDTMTGGDGADRFILEYDGETDTITDFEAGTDQLDLAYFPLVYQPEDLGFTSTISGARIIFQGDVTEIYSKDGKPLTANQVFAISPFDLTRTIHNLGPEIPEAGPNVMIGSMIANLLIGTGEDDFFYGAQGNDTFAGMAGADVFSGGLGFDTVDYSTSVVGVTIDMRTTETGTGDANGDTFYSIEAVAGSDFDDTIIGIGSDDALIGNQGDDTLDGNGGNDALQGGAGNDVLIGGAGADVLDGGAGWDTIEYSSASEFVFVDLGGRYSGMGDAAGDLIIDVENVSGGSFADILFGGDGADSLDGGEGDDILEGNANGDALVGGNGIDTASFALSSLGVTADLSDQSANTGDASGDSYVQIEALLGTRFDDLLVGDAGDNLLLGSQGNDDLRGGNGDDMLSGGFGDDRITGGDGDDLLSGGTGADEFVFDAIFGTDHISDFQTGIDLVEIEASLLTMPPIDAANFLANFGNETGGHAVIDLGANGAIHFDNVTDLVALSDSFIFV